MVKLIDRLLGRKTEEQDEFIEPVRLDEPMTQPSSRGLTLDAATVVGEEALDDLDRFTAGLAANPTQGVRVSIDHLGMAVSELYRDYEQEARGEITRLAHDFHVLSDKLEKQEDRPPQAAIDKLRSDAKAVLVRKAEGQVADDSRMRELVTKIRLLTVGITGNPSYEVKAPGIVVKRVVPTGFAIASLVLEFMLNFGTFQHQSDQWSATAFSIVISIAGLLFAYFAANAMRERNTYENAVQALESLKEGHSGELIDTDTKQPLKVFPMDAMQRRSSRLLHAATIILLVAVVGFRTYLVTLDPDAGLGPIGGNIAFVVLVAGIYICEFKRPGIEHPRLQELIELCKERDSLQQGDPSEEEGGDEFDRQLNELAAEFDRTYRQGHASRQRPSVGQVNAAREAFRVVYEQYRRANAWFVELARTHLEALVGLYRARPDFTDHASIPADLRATAESLLFLVQPADHERILRHYPQSAAPAVPGVDVERLKNDLWPSAMDEARLRASSAAQSATGPGFHLAPVFKTRMRGIRSQN